MDKPAPAKRARQKRNRVITACSNCRVSKAGCDRSKPICSRCISKGDDCIYLDPPNHALINGIKKEISSLPTDIKESVTRLYNQCLGDVKDEDASDYEGLESTPFAAESASFDDDIDETTTSDFGFRIGKAYLTDRLGGQFRPVVAQEVSLSGIFVAIAANPFSFKCCCRPPVIKENGPRSKQNGRRPQRCMRWDCPRQTKRFSNPAPTTWLPSSMSSRSSRMSMS